MKKEELLNEMYILVRRFDRDLLELMNLMRNNNELSDEIDIGKLNDITNERKFDALERKVIREGEQFDSEIIRILSKVGAFCSLDSNCDGFIHISKMSDKRIGAVEEVLNIGDRVRVEIVKVTPKGIDLKLIENLTKNNKTL